jgi:hypothetical protein
MNPFMISFVIWAPGIILSWVEMFGRPHYLLCDCRAGFLAYRHLKSVWLFVIGALYVGSDLIAVVWGGEKAPIVALIGVYYLWRWWNHSKGGRKKLKNKVLGVVRATVAGLKVVPIPVGNHA